MAWLRHAKIVCTLGPATFSEKRIEELMSVGMDVARLNFSHGDYETYKKVIKTVRAQSRRLKKPVTIIQDLQGPKIRTGKLVDGKLVLKRGERLRVTTRKVHGSDHLISIPYRLLPRLLKRGIRF